MDIVYIEKNMRKFFIIFALGIIADIRKVETNSKPREGGAWDHKGR